MKRNDFLKLSGLTATGFATGLISPLSLFGRNLTPYEIQRLSILPFAKKKVKKPN